MIAVELNGKYAGDRKYRKMSDAIAAAKSHNSDTVCIEVWQECKTKRSNRRYRIAFSPIGQTIFCIGGAK